MTPVGFGNGLWPLRFDVRKVGHGGSFDVFLYGAQLERSDEVTPLVDTRPVWLPPSALDRVDVRHLTATTPHRVEALSASMLVWRENAWFGVGKTQARAALGAASTSGVEHAHNQVVQILLESGVVGFVGWALVGAGVWWAVPRAGWWRLASLVASLLVLNSWDATLFDRTGFYALVIALGVVATSHRPRRGAGGEARG